MNQLKGEFAQIKHKPPVRHFGLSHFVEKVLSISRHAFSPSIHPGPRLLFPTGDFCRLHQRAGLALSRHHDSNSSHACQSGGAHLRGHSERRWHLRLRPLSPFGDGDHRAPEDLRRGPVRVGRPLVFARRSASVVVAGESLQGAGFSRPQLVGIDNRACVRRRGGGVRVVEVGLMGVSWSRTGGYGGQRAVLGHDVGAGVALCP